MIAWLYSQGPQNEHTTLSDVNTLSYAVDINVHIKFVGNCGHIIPLELHKQHVENLEPGFQVDSSSRM